MVIEHKRRSIRLKGYAYSSAGAYFVTICAQDRECLFGGIEKGEMILNDAGKMIRTIWDEIPKYYPGIAIDVFQMMPNHVHGIIIVGATPRGCPHDMGRVDDGYVDNIGDDMGIGQARGYNNDDEIVIVGYNPSF